MAPWQDVEVAVSLLYQLGETAPEADMKPGSGVLAQLAAGVMQVGRVAVAVVVEVVVCALWETSWRGCAAVTAAASACSGGAPPHLSPHLSPQEQGRHQLPVKRMLLLPCRCLACRPLQADVVSAKHRLVALALLETYVRYSRVLAAGGGATLAAVVPRFLGDRGMGHPCEAVSRRAAYLFCRLAKQLRSTLRPLLPDILQVWRGGGEAVGVRE